MSKIIEALASTIIKYFQDYFDYLDIERPEGVEFIKFNKIVSINEAVVVVEYEVDILDHHLSDRVKVVTELGRFLIDQMECDLERKLRLLYDKSEPDPYDKLADRELEHDR